MNIKIIIAILSVSTIAYSCTNSAKKNQQNIADSTASSLRTHNSTFFDSVYNQADLSFTQVKHHTLIDNTYFTSKSTFTGDTIYYRNSDYPMIILKYDDHLVCSKKILLVYNKRTLKNTDWLLVATGCDEDYSTDFSRLSYMVFNNKQFYTREVKHLRNEGKKTKVTFADKFYQINSLGKIDSLSKKPIGITLPTFDPSGEINEEDN